MIWTTNRIPLPFPCIPEIKHSNAFSGQADNVNEWRGAGTLNKGMLKNTEANRRTHVESKEADITYLQSNVAIQMWAQN